ncbi:hypothetical protein COCNU_08G001400 [Cocos nucifera]|uniref:Uncharacterized protein n=1 Tax=Cocos nucifera TaxID=13894 RepID=A0A8K0N5W7_COCNU|nr:hypothetical protein COCNU_08G001400 [Cocos nucifera]
MLLGSRHTLDYALLGTSQLLPKGPGCSNHVGKCRLDLGVLSSLEPTVRVNPQDVALEHRQHLVNSVSNLLWGWDSG